MTEFGLDPKWVDNLHAFLVVFCSVSALLFALIGGLAKFFDERAQIPDKIQRERDLSRVRKFYRVLSRVVSYGGWDATIDNSVFATRKLLTRALLRPDPRFDPDSDSASFPWLILIPFTAAFSWGLYFLYAACLNSMDYVLARMIEAAYQSKQPTLVKNPDGSWSGFLVTLVALPAFAFALTIFPALWGRGVIELWQMLIRKLPHPIWQAYRPYSQVPKLLLYSFSITLVAIALGKFVSPGSPAPESTRILLLNTFGDALSILLAGYAFRRIQYRRRFFSRARRLAQTFVVLSTLIVALSVASIVALWGGVYGTPQAVSLEAAAHILVAKPYHDLTFATPVELQGHATTVGDFYIKALNESVAKGETKPDVGFWIVVMVASNTGRINLIDDWVSRYSMRDPDNRLPEIKRFASQKFHSADGIGPYFWIMHTTFMPILILSLVALLHSVSLFIRKPVAYVFAAAGKVERPNNLIVVTCGAISAFFVLAARLLTW